MSTPQVIATTYRATVRPGEVSTPGQGPDTSVVLQALKNLLVKAKVWTFRLQLDNDWKFLSH